MKSVVVFLAGVLSSYAGPSIRVLADLHIGATRYRALVGTLDENQLTSEIMRTLGSPSVKVGRLVVYGSEKSSKLTILERSYPNCDASSRATFLESNGLIYGPHLCPEVSEAIKIGSDIIVRTINSRCQVRRSHLRGESDRLWLEARGRSHEVIGIGLQSTEIRGTELPRIHVLVRTEQALTEDLGTELVSAVRTISGAGDVFVALRNDEVFFPRCTFTIPLLFVDKQKFKPTDDSWRNDLSCSFFSSLYPRSAGCLARVPKR